jgi:hypothetical protein
MNTGRNSKTTQQVAQLLTFIVAFLGFIGCNKNQGTITANPWRLVASTDPSMQGKLNCYTFLIFTFNVNETGDVKLVQNNTQYDTPARTFIYTVDTPNSMLRVKYAYPGGGQTGNTANGNAAGNNTNGATGQSSSGDTPVDYQYNLNSVAKTLDLTDSNGYTMNFVSFTGIVPPDQECNFPGAPTPGN